MKSSVSKEGKLTPFELANVINLKQEVPSRELLNKFYAPFMSNRIFSNTADTVFFANEMNRLFGTVTPDMHFDFLYYSLSKKKRFGKWHKKGDDKNSIAIVQEFFGYSYHRAREVLDLVKDHIPEMKKALDRGGRK